MISKASDFRLIFTVGLVRALDTRRLTREHWDMLTGSGSMEDLISILGDTVYWEHLEAAGAEDILKDISRRRRDVLYELVFRFTFDDNMASMLVAGFDFHNIRVLLRESLFGIQGDKLMLPWGKVELAFMREVFQHEEYQLLPVDMRKAVEEGVEVYYGRKDIMAMDSVIDSWRYHAMMRQADACESEFTRRHLGLRIDCENIETVLRGVRRNEEASVVRACLISGGSLQEEMLVTGAYGEDGGMRGVLAEEGFEQLIDAVEKYPERPHVLQKACAKMKGEMLRETDFMISGFEPLYAYVQRVEHELSVLGSIAAMIAIGLNPGEIRASVPEFW